MGRLNPPDTPPSVLLAMRRDGAGPDPAVQQRYRALDLLATLVVVVDVQGRVVYANPSFEDALGMS
eukprot:14172-Eustigmatos_ZCMA.PRE.1